MDVEGYPLWSHFSSCPPSELLGERELNSSFKGTRGNSLILLYLHPPFLVEGLGISWAYERKGLPTKEACKGKNSCCFKKDLAKSTSEVRHERL
ncbi:hypothetical protein V6N13_034877 [Hibiscus sabdariffa]